METTKMILEFKRRDTTMVEDFDTDTSYLNEADAFEVNTHVHEWPAVRNPFLDRMAQQLKPGFSGRLNVHDFLSLVSGATDQRGNSVLDFNVTVGTDEENLPQISFTVLKIDKAGLVPLTADNAGFFAYAMGWMAKHRPAFKMSVCGREFFWVHVADA
jgi:hypothetical protein